MAIKIKDRYPGQHSDADPTGYPDGAPRDDLTEDDGTGTPLQHDWVRDWEGFKQSLLAEAGIEASGTPEKVGASQLYAALHVLFADNPNTDFVLALLDDRLDTAELDIDDHEDRLDDVEDALDEIGPGDFTGGTVHDLVGISAVEPTTDKIIYQQVGNRVSASAFFSITNSDAGAKSFAFTLPAKTSSFVGAASAIGDGSVYAASNGESVAHVSSVDGTTRAKVEWYNTRTSGSESLRIHFHYNVGA